MRQAIARAAVATGSRRSPLDATAAACDGGQWSSAASKLPQKKCGCQAALLHPSAAAFRTLFGTGLNQTKETTFTKRRSE